MATTSMSAIFVPPTSPSVTRKINLSSGNDKFVIPQIFPFRSPNYQFRKPPSCSSSNGAAVQSSRNTSELPISVDALQRFIRLNLGNWTGSFHVSITSFQLTLLKCFYKYFFQMSFCWMSLI